MYLLYILYIIFIIYLYLFTENKTPRVFNVVLNRQEPSLHTSATLPLGRVPGIYWKHWKHFQVSTGKSSRVILERVTRIYWKEFQGN
jgi:hypothetical protein